VILLSVVFFLMVFIIVLRFTCMVFSLFLFNCFIFNFESFRYCWWFLFVVCMFVLFCLDCGLVCGFVLV